MVLEKLGISLKNSLAKIAKSVFVDERLVNELVKDIQRALLQADVNVKLVLELSNNIKKRALEEKAPSGISQREYLIKIVYEELTKFLGGEKNEIKIDKKPFKILLIGLFGSGKCVHSKSKIPLSNGEIIEAKELFNKFNYLDKESLKDGVSIDVNDCNIFVPSFNPNTLKIESKKITHLWRLEGKDLVNVKLDNGNNFEVKVTPEHPFFVMRKGKFLQIRADGLNEDDYVAIPREYKISEQGQTNFLDELKKMDLDIYLDNTKISKILNGKTIKDLYKNLKFKRNYCKLTINLKNGKMPLSCLDFIDSPSMKIELKSAFKSIYFPSYMTSDLAEFLGYLIGDGHLVKRGIEISNEDKEIIDRVCHLSKNLFGLIPEIKRDYRTKAMYRIRITSVTLAMIFNKIFKIPFGKKGRDLGIPQNILISSNEILRKFIRAYLDCDGFAAKNTREIELLSESNVLIKQLSMALLRFKIISSISSKNINGKDYYRLFIRSKYAEEYAKKIGFLVNKKQERASNFCTIGIRQGCGKQDMIPLASKLKELRESLGFSIGEIQSNGVNSYGRYEGSGLISRESILKTLTFYASKEGNIKNTLSNIDSLNDKFSRPFVNSLVAHLTDSGLITKENNILILTRGGQIILSKLNENKTNYLLEFSMLLAESDVCWARVSDIENIENDSKYVYDLTVEDNHSFIADNIIVHNTTQAGKLAKYFQKRSHKVALVGTDTWRPAALKQLQSLGKQINVDVYGDESEKDPVKIYKKFEDKLNSYDIIIVDSAGRDALNGELIQEIESLNSYVSPDEVLLVMSADIGQAAQKQAEQFHESCGVNGVIVTKMDGTAKGGGALSACSVTNAPIKFIGVGEKVDDLEQFNPKGFVGRLLGMGDLEALLEKAQDVIDEEAAEDLGKKFLKGDFNFLDLYEQMNTMSKMGSLSKIVNLIPGMSNLNIPKDMIEGQEGKLKVWKHIMQSMTKKELEDPDIITRNRIDRIAKGAGVKVQDVRELLKQYRQSKKMMKVLKGSAGADANKLLKRFKGKVPKGMQ